MVLKLYGEWTPITIRSETREVRETVKALHKSVQRELASLVRALEKCEGARD